MELSESLDHFGSKLFKVEKLKKVLGNFRSLFSSNSNAVFALDTEGCFVIVNQTSENLSGYTQEELSTMRFQDVISTEELSKVTSLFEQSLQGEHLNFDSSFLSKSKQVIEINITIIPIFLNNKVLGLFGVYGIIKM